MFTRCPFKIIAFGLSLACARYCALAQTNGPFDGHPWHISTGNLSVMFTQASPIGAFPRTNFIEAPPSVESMIQLRNLGLVADEDYISWGAVDPEPGRWFWKQN